jgi:hypothetical protein
MKITGWPLLLMATSSSSRMRKKPDGHEYLGAGVEISGLRGELAVESGWRRRFTD